MLVAVPVGALGLLAVMVGGSRSSTTNAQSTTTTTTATIASPSTAGATTASTAATIGANASPTSIDPPSAAATTATRAAGAPGSESDVTGNDMRAPAPPKAAGETRPAANGATGETSAANGATAEVAGAGFGVTASAPASPSGAPGAGAPNRTWHRADELKLTIGSDTIDVTAPSAFHTGADVPVLHVGGRTHSSSSFVAPNVIRFTGTGAVAPGDEIAIAYGKGAPTVLRRGAAR